MNPSAITPDFLVSVGARMAVYCPECRSSRAVDPLALVVAGKGPELISKLPFVCSSHPGVRGTAYVDWHDVDGRARVEIVPE